MLKFVRGDYLQNYPAHITIVRTGTLYNKAIKEILKFVKELSWEKIGDWIQVECDKIGTTRQVFGVAIVVLWQVLVIWFVFCRKGGEQYEKRRWRKPSKIAAKIQIQAPPLVLKEKRLNDVGDTFTCGSIFKLEIQQFLIIDILFD